MKLVKTEKAVGMVLPHDMTEIIPGVSKGPRFRKGHVIVPEDIPVLLSMGKENIYALENRRGMVHENDAAERLCRLCMGPNMARGEVREGKIELAAEIPGLFTVDSARLLKVNSVSEVMIASRHGGFAVKEGDKLAGMRVIPLMIGEGRLRRAERAAGDRPLFSLLPFCMKSAAVITTGSEIYKGRKEDAFTPVIRDKLSAFGIEVIFHEVCDDSLEMISSAIAAARLSKPDVILCTGGMSVDPDDRTPGAIRRSGARVVTYGAPVLPGAMIMLGYLDDGVPIMGLPGCVMYAKTTVFDIMLPRLAAGLRPERRDFVSLGEGGLCLGCAGCSFPTCGFGK